MDTLSYQVIGEGKPLVLLHGFLENKNMWNFLQFSDENTFQLILIDLPGHGNSPCYQTVHTMDFMAEKVVEVLENINIPKAHIFGHSMGGYVGLSIAENYPEMVESIGLFFSSPFEDSELKKDQRDRAVILALTDKEDFIRLGIPNLFNRHKLDELTEPINIAKEMAMKTPIEGITSAILGMKVRPDRSEFLITNPKPVLWIYGEYDNAVDDKQIRQLLKKNHDIQEYQLPIGHMGHLESPDICSSIIHSFYKDL